MEYILKHGMFRFGHPQADPNYINIGDSTLIKQRHFHPVKIDPPGGNLGEYVPFYLGPYSPMLYNIKTGFRGITKRPQSDIIYISCPLIQLTDHCEQWCFTDGHAKTFLTEFYNNLADLSEVDWDTVAAKKWNSVDGDMDRMRRKQAEFLVKDHVPVDCINKVVVYNAEKRKLVQAIVDHLQLKIPVLTDTQSQYYYL